jgi:DNA-binding protein Fis
MTETRGGKTKKTGQPAKAPEKVMTQAENQSTGVPMHDLLGQKLRAYYEQVASEPVPDRFESLLRELEAKSPKKKPS